MKNRTSTWMVAFAFIGALAGLLAPKVSASVAVTMRFLPPALQTMGYDAQLTTGWHETFGDLNALDWGRFKSDGTEDWGAYLRSMGSSSDTTLRSAAVIYRDDSIGCYRLRADIYDELDATYKGTIFFTHVLPDSGVSSVYLENDGTWSSHRVGEMAWPDKSGCPTDGPHIHQYNHSTSYYGGSGGGAFSRNTSKYSSSDEGKRFDNATLSNWTHMLSW